VRRYQSQSMFLKMKVVEIDILKAINTKK